MSVDGLVKCYWLILVVGYHIAHSVVPFELVMAEYPARVPAPCGGIRCGTLNELCLRVICAACEAGNPCQTPFSGLVVSFKG